MLRVATVARRDAAMPMICTSRISTDRPSRCRRAAIVPAACGRQVERLHSAVEVVGEELGTDRPAASDGDLASKSSMPVRISNTVTDVVQIDSVGWLSSQSTTPRIGVVPHQRRQNIGVEQNHDSSKLAGWTDWPRISGMSSVRPEPSKRDAIREPKRPRGASTFRTAFRGSRAPLLCATAVLACQSLQFSFGVVPQVDGSESAPQENDSMISKIKSVAV